MRREIQNEETQVTLTPDEDLQPADSILTVRSFKVHAREPLYNAAKIALEKFVCLTM